MLNRQEEDDKLAQKRKGAEEKLALDEDEG